MYSYDNLCYEMAALKHYFGIVANPSGSMFCFIVDFTEIANYLFYDTKYFFLTLSVRFGV